MLRLLEPFRSITHGNMQSNMPLHINKYHLNPFNKVETFIGLSLACHCNSDSQTTLMLFLNGNYSNLFSVMNSVIYLDFSSQKWYPLGNHTTCSELLWVIPLIILFMLLQ